MYEERLSPSRQLLRARTQLQKKAYFIYSILVYSKYRIAPPEEVEQWEHKTARANMLGDIDVAAEYIEDKSDNFVEALLYHEVIHLVLMHPVLCKGRIRELWNIAADIKANSYVSQGGYNVPSEWIQADMRGIFELKVTMPDGTQEAIATVEGCNSKSAITIYDELYEQLKDNAQIMSGGKFGDRKGSKKSDKGNVSGEVPNHDGWEDEVDGKSRERVINELKDRVRDAYETAKRQGTLSGDLERSIGELLESKTSWKDILKATIISAMPYETSYRLPHKRSYAIGIYMPHIEKESSDVIIALDTSGSISQNHLAAFVSEIVAMSRQCHNLNMEVIICDADIHEVYPVRNGSIDDIMAIKMSGGGGTSHIPVFEYCKTHKSGAKLLVNFTDGFTTFPKPEDVSIETLWVLTENSIAPEKIPFGRVIRMGTKVL